MFSTPLNEEFIKKEASDTSKQTQPVTPEPPVQPEQIKADSKPDDKPVQNTLDTQATASKDKAEAKSNSKTTTGTKAKAAQKAKAKAANQATTKTASKGKPSTKKSEKPAVKNDAKPAAKKTVKVAAKKDSKKPKADASSVSDSQEGKDEL